MIVRLCWCLGLCGLVALLIVSIVTASAAANTVPSTSVDYHTFGIDANDLKPAACAGLNLTSIVSGSGTISGDAGNTLILGSSGDDTITGMDGSDCIVGGGGDDTLVGGGGDDVLIGGPGADSCTGGLGDNTFASSCEVQEP